MNKEVDGVTGEIALRPAPVACFDDEAGKGGQDEITRVARDQSEILFFEQKTFAGADDERQGFGREGVVAEPARSS